MEVLFVGGPGRSGTSLVADRMGGHPDIVALKDIELKIFSEKNGLLDLHHSLTERYSPNRGPVALDQFLKLTDSLIDGRFGQRPLSDVAPAADWRDCFQSFAAALRTADHTPRCAESAFFRAANALLCSIAQIAAQQNETGNPGQIFLEKTPHALLGIDFLERIEPNAKYLHVMRDPRSIAKSLLRMRWAPGSLVGCCRWVESYCETWATVESQSYIRSGRLKCLRIEDVASAPEQISIDLCTWLGLSPQISLFANADTTVLNGWVSTSEPSEVAFLNRTLGRWVRHFGYRETEIGASSDRSELVS